MNIYHLIYIGGLIVIPIIILIINHFTHTVSREEWTHEWAGGASIFAFALLLSMWPIIIGFIILIGLFCFASCLASRLLPSNPNYVPPKPDTGSWD